MPACPARHDRYPFFRGPRLGSALGPPRAEAQSAAGRALCLELTLAADAAEATRRMAAVAELAMWLRAGEPLPSLAAPEIETALASAEKGIVLGADELRPVAVLTDIAEGARRAFLAPPRGTRAPAPGGRGAGRAARSAPRAGADDRHDVRRFGRDQRRGLAGAGAAAGGAQGIGRERPGGDRAADALRGVRVGPAGSVLHGARGAVRVAAQGERKVARARHRPRHVAHRRDGVRRADGAGGGEQPAQGRRARHPARVAADPRGAHRRRRDARRRRCARAPPRWPRSTRWRRLPGWDRLRRDGNRDRRRAGRRSRQARHPLLALAHATANGAARAPGREGHCGREGRGQRRRARRPVGARS